jgi:hypothetical protein
VIDRVSQDVLLSLILVSGVVAVSDRSKGLAWVALVMLVTIVVRWLGRLSPNVPGRAIPDAVGIFSLTLLGAIMEIKAVGAGTVTRDRIGGAVALYMLIGLVWADAYH